MIVSFKNVGLRYDLNSEILHDVNFSIEPCSFQFLCGPSGSGKTSLLKLMSLRLSPTRGFINILGQDSLLLDSQEKHLLRRDIGIIFQDFYLLDHLTSYENVALAYKVREIEEYKYKHDVIELLNWVGLGNRIHSYPKILSAGEKQRVAIARAVITKPKLLLADEPTGNLDQELAQRLLQLFLQLNKFGTAIILATHDLSLLQHHEQRCLKIVDKRVIIHEPK